MRSAVRPSSTKQSAYVTASRSVKPETTARSWVIQISAVPRSAQSRCISARICAWMMTSSAGVGSSAMMRSGSLSSAMATRWRIHPRTDADRLQAARQATGYHHGQRITCSTPCLFSADIRGLGLRFFGHRLGRLQQLGIPASRNRYQARRTGPKYQAIPRFTPLRTRSSSKSSFVGDLALGFEPGSGPANRYPLVSKTLEKPRFGAQNEQ